MSTTRSTSTETSTQTTGDAGSDMTTGTRSIELPGGYSVSSTEIRGAVDTVARQVPEVARTSRGFMEDWMQQIEGSSDERVTAGVTLSLGVAIGLLAAGAPRLLAALALLPVVVSGASSVALVVGSVARVVAIRTSSPA